MNKRKKQIYCAGCEADVTADLVTGAVIYPHRPDLHSLPFWICMTCGGYVGCHHKTKDRTRLLGIIPTAELRNARKHIHGILDPLWKTAEDRRHQRSVLYKFIAEKLEIKEFHTAEIRTIERAREIYCLVRKIKNGELTP